MSISNNRFSFITLFGFIFDSFGSAILKGLRKGSIGWLLIEVIALVVLTYLIINPILSIIPYMFGEDFVDINEVIQFARESASSHETSRSIQIPMIEIQSETFMTIFYPIVIYICSRGLSNKFKGVLCFLGGFVGLLSLFEIKYYYFFLSSISEKGELYVFLLISYYTIGFLIYFLMISDISFARLDKAWLGSLFPLILFLGIALIYRIIGKNHKIHDIVILFSFSLFVLTIYTLSSLYIKNELSQSIKKPQSEGLINYDVFICYRRNVNSDVARLIRSALNNKEIKAFLDIEDLGAKYFDERIVEIIKASHSFILILSPGDLNNCIDENDWLRKEISTALRCNILLIPILKDGFEWSPDINLPPDLINLPRHNSIKYSHDYFEAVINKIVDFMKNSEAYVKNVKTL